MEKTIWTAFCSYADSPRGSYDEEIDVEAAWNARETAVRRKAQAILDADYDKSLRIRRVVRRGPGLFI